MIFDGVVGSTGEILCNTGPAIAEVVMVAEQDFFLSFAPGPIIDARVELVVPPEFKSVYLSRHCLPLRPGILYSCSIILETILHFLMLRCSRISISTLSS